MLNFEEMRFPIDVILVCIRYFTPGNRSKFQNVASIPESHTGCKEGINGTLYGKLAVQ